MSISKTNVPVLMVFFNRPEPLKKVFEAVRKAKPSVLFIAQDGARYGNTSDEENIKKCRDVVANIDWECEVRYNYSVENLGCGGRMSSAITWAFEYVDRLMILEDDCVPGQAFFSFCEELLEKYKDDERISMISAMNHLGEYDNYNHDSYIFCNSGAIWAWATWKREWKYYDFHMDFVEKYNIFDKIKKSSYPSYYKADLLWQGKDRLKTLSSGQKLSSWTFQYNSIRFMNHQLTIVPAVNLMSNIGLTSDSTHASSNLKMIPKGLQSIFMMPVSDMKFPLSHPEIMWCDDEFDRKVWRLMGLPKHISDYRKIEGIVRQIIYGDGKKLLCKIRKKVAKK